MQFPKQFVWLGATTLLVASFIVPIYLQRAEDAPQQTVSEPELFGFVRPMESVARAKSHNHIAGSALVVNAELERLFADFIAAYGETPPASLTTDLNQEIARYFKPDTVSEATRLFERYLAYRRELHRVEKDFCIGAGSAATARAHLETKQRMRARFFSVQESEALFSLADAQEMDALARLEINQDATLNDLERQERLAALDAAAPPALREAQEAPLKAVRLDEATQRLRAEGASDSEIFRVRAAAYSPDVAQRLKEADQKQKIWQDRVASYLAARTRLMEDPALPYENRPAALQQLRDAHFNADEQTLISVYE